MFAVIALWSAADVVVMFGAERVFPRAEALAFLLRVGISFAIGVVLFVYFLPIWSSVVEEQ